MKIKKILIIIILQLAVIAALALIIKNKKNNVLGETHMNVINKNDVIGNPNNEFNFVYELKPNNKIETREKGAPYNATYTINSDSLNERFDYPVEKAEGIFRVITLGNSYTFGAYVDTKDNWTEVLEDLLNDNKTCKHVGKYEVINLAGQGYDLKYLVERFQTKGKKYNPDLIIWFLTNNDFVQINELLLPKVSYYSKELKKKSEENIYTRAWSMSLKDLSNEYDQNQLMQKQVGTLKKLRDNYNNNIVFATYASFTKNIYKKKVEQFVNNYQSNTFFFSDVTNIYQSADLYYLTDGHPTQKGHKTIAQDILNYLKDKNLIDCN